MENSGKIKLGAFNFRLWRIEAKRVFEKGTSRALFTSPSNIDNLDNRANFTGILARFLHDVATACTLLKLKSILVQKEG